MYLTLSTFSCFLDVKISADVLLNILFSQAVKVFLLYILHGCCIGTPKGTHFQGWSLATGQTIQNNWCCTDQSLPSAQQISLDQMTYAMDTARVPWTLRRACHTLWHLYYLLHAPLPPRKTHEIIRWKLGDSLPIKQPLWPSAVGVVLC